jgi:hypothetical protein
VHQHPTIIEKCSASQRVPHNEEEYPIIAGNIRIKPLREKIRGHELSLRDSRSHRVEEEAVRQVGTVL